MKVSLLTLFLLAQPPEAPAPQQPEAKPLMPGRETLSIPFEKYSLPNGLEVILARDSKLPVVAVDVWYHVGAFDERPGRTGFAHLFEHMMFQGSKHVPDKVHMPMLEQLGATDINGTTDFDRTNYFETVPSNQLATALWLESDRMGFLLDSLNDKKLANQREVVKNERRQGTEAAPYGLAEEKLWHALFPAPHPYHGQIIGSMEDLDAATLEDVKAFFRTWYSPANATLAVAGDFDPAQARALIERYFASLSGPPRPAHPEVAPVHHTQETVLRHAEQLGTLPRVTMAWLTPAYLTQGDAVADMLATVLGTGKSGRLYKRLVLDKGLAQSVSADQQGLGAQSVFTLEATARPGVSSDALAREMDAVLEELRRTGPTPAELQQARTRFETRMISGLQAVGGFSGKADTLQNYNHFRGDPGFLPSDLERYDAVTPEAVRDFVREQLRPDARVVLHAVPASKETP